MGLEWVADVVRMVMAASMGRVSATDQTGRSDALRDAESGFIDDHYNSALKHVYVWENQFAEWTLDILVEYEESLGARDDRIRIEGEWYMASGRHEKAIIAYPCVEPLIELD